MIAVGDRLTLRGFPVTVTGFLGQTLAGRQRGWVVVEDDLGSRKAVQAGELLPPLPPSGRRRPTTKQAVEAAARQAIKELEP